MNDNKQEYNVHVELGRLIGKTEALEERIRLLEESLEKQNKRMLRQAEHIQNSYNSIQELCVVVGRLSDGLGELAHTIYSP